MTDPETRLTVLLAKRWDYSPKYPEDAREDAQYIMAADPTLICPDPAAHWTRNQAVSAREVADIATTPLEPEGFWFTVDSLAAAFHADGCGCGSWPTVSAIHDDSYRERAAAILKAAKEASDE